MMRIIGGTHRSRRILPPLPPAKPGREAVTRPITDRVKQSLFDRLDNAGLLEGQAILDVFAGTGSLGLEALSRGASHCAFIERHRPAKARLTQNLADLDLTDQATVLGVDALTAHWIGMLPRRPVSVVFFDPPYRLTEQGQSLSRIMNVIEALTTVMAPTSLLALRTHQRANPPPASGWDNPATHTFGAMALHLYTRITPPG